MTEQEENELICEKLLKWRLAGRNTFCHKMWLDMPQGSDGDQWHARVTPSFDTWAEAGLILDALANLDQMPDVGFWNGWSCMIKATDESCEPSVGQTGPLAVRSAALEYIKSMQAQHAEPNLQR